MKKFVMAVTTAALLTTAAQANTCASYFSGFYAGLQAGMNSTVGTMKSDNGVTGANNINANGSRGSQAFIGGLFAGYGMGVGSCAYVGGEFSGNFTNDSAKLYDDSDSVVGNRAFKVTASNNLSCGAKLRLGYTVSPQAMIFLGLGMEYAKWQLKAENLLATQTGIDTTTKKNRSGFAFAPSVGMEMFMTKNIFVRGEYTYVATGSQKIEPQYLSVGVKYTQTYKSNVNQHRFTLGLGYKF